MQTIHEPARETPVAHECDVCVLGGSCTGVFAAIAAARLGMSVAIVEAMGYFGGTATISMVCVWHSRFDTVGKMPIYAGLTMEAVERLRRRGELFDHGPDPSRQFDFAPATLAAELDRMVLDAGIRPFLHTRFVAPIVGDDGRIAAAVIEDKTGRRAIKARFFIDATGDADLAHRAGFETYKGPRLQPPTACVLFENLDPPDAAMGKLRKEVFNPAHPDALKPGFLWGSALPGTHVTMVAGTRVHGADCSDADQLTAAEIEGRRQIRAMMDIANRTFAAEKKLQLIGIPARIGIRQTRQVKCYHQLTEKEVLYGKRFDDAVANGSYRVDVHAAHGEGLIFRYLDGRETVAYATGGGKNGRWRDPIDVDPTFYQIPYRCLVPQNARNLLIAGRCLDADEGAFGAVRVMVNCNQTGEAAGTAAVIALRDGVDSPGVDVGKLRKTLAERGAIVI